MQYHQYSIWTQLGQDLHKIEFKLSSYFYKIKISEKIAKISRETLGVLIKNFEAGGQEFAGQCSLVESEF
jgi:hypothetical protein